MAEATASALANAAALTCRHCVSHRISIWAFKGKGAHDRDSEGGSGGTLDSLAAVDLLAAFDSLAAVDSLVGPVDGSAVAVGSRITVEVVTPKGAAL